MATSRVELFETLGCVSGDRLEQVSHMVADVIAVQHGTEEPALRVVEDRDVLRSGVPRAPFELVDPVAGFAAEQPGDFGMRPRHQMHRQVVGPQCDPIGVVAFRQADEKA